MLLPNSFLLCVPGFFCEQLTMMTRSSTRDLGNNSILLKTPPWSINQDQSHTLAANIQSRLPSWIWFRGVLMTPHDNRKAAQCCHVVDLCFFFAPPRFLHLPRLLTSWFLGQTGSSSLPPYTKYTKQAEPSFAKLSRLIYHLGDHFLQNSFSMLPN